MTRTRLLFLLKKMPIRDLARFGRFVGSDYFCKHLATRRLAEILLAAAPDFLGENLAKRDVFKKVFGEAEPYNELKINNLVSDLLALLLEFLAQQQFEAHPTAQLFGQLDALLELEELGQFESVSRRFFRQKAGQVQKKGQSSGGSADFWRNEAGYFERLDRAFIQTGRRVFDENLQRQSDALDRAFALDKLRLACGMISRGQVVSGQYEPHFLGEIKGWLDRRPEWQADPVFQIYGAALAMLERLQPADYQRLVTLLAAHDNLLPTAESFALWHYSLNFCIRQINAGRSDWYPETFRLYRTLLDRGVLFKQGHLSPWAYKNIVTAGLRTRDFDWTARFIADFREKLPPEERENAHAYNLAALAHEQKNFAAALAALQTVEFTDLSYALGAKIIQLKCWFRMGEEEALFSLIDTTKKWLLRQSKMPEHGRRANLNFLKILRPLFHLAHAGNLMRPTDFKKKWAALHKKIEQLEPIANKEWLEEASSFAP